MRLFTTIPTRAAAWGLLVTLSLMWSGLPAAAQTQAVPEAPVEAESPEPAEPQTAQPRQPDPRLLHDYVARLPIGAHVKIRLLSGDTFKGTLMRVDPDTIIVKPRTRTPHPERHIPLTELDFVDPDPQNGSKMGKVAGIAILASTATFVGIVLLMRAIYSD